MSRINFRISIVEREKSFLTSGPERRDVVYRNYKLRQTCPYIKTLRDNSINTESSRVVSCSIIINLISVSDISRL